MILINVRYLLLLKKIQHSLAHFLHFEIGLVHNKIKLNKIYQIVQRALGTITINLSHSHKIFHRTPQMVHFLVDKAKADIIEEMVILVKAIEEEIILVKAVAGVAGAVTDIIVDMMVMEMAIIGDMVVMAVGLDRIKIININGNLEIKADRIMILKCLMLILKIGKNKVRLNFMNFILNLNQKAILTPLLIIFQNLKIFKNLTLKMMRL